MKKFNEKARAVMFVYYIFCILVGVFITTLIYTIMLMVGESFAALIILAFILAFAVHGVLCTPALYRWVGREYNVRSEN